MYPDQQGNDYTKDAPKISPPQRHICAREIELSASSIPLAGVAFAQ
jgi:hypothetical protein